MRWTAIAYAALALSLASSARAQEARESTGFSLAQHDLLSFGTNEDSFINASVGARIDYAVTPVFRLGIEIAYANLDADPKRAHSVVGLFQFEARATLNETWSVPARIAAGHLVKNGAVLRLGAGLAAKLGTRMEVVLEVAPTFFSTEDGLYPAVGPGFELAVTL